MGLGIPKAVSAHREHPLISPSMDLVGGVVLGLLYVQPFFVEFKDFVKLMLLRLLWLGVIEATRPESCPSFFQVDLASAILLASRLRHRNTDTSPLDPETQEIPRRGDTSPLAPEILGVLSNDNYPPLIPGIPGVLDRDNTSPPLYSATLGSLRHDNTLPLAPPPTLPVGPVRRASSPLGHEMDFIFDPITVPGNDEMLTAMQAIQSPNWLENMLMPGCVDGSLSLSCACRSDLSFTDSLGPRKCLHRPTPHLWILKPRKFRVVATPHHCPPKSWRV